MKVWDARAGPSATLTLGVAPGDINSTTHKHLITCLDVAGDLVLSGSIDQSIAAWDLRMGQTAPVAVAGSTSVSCCSVM